ncbi:3-phosphoglycerate dehydrogenase [Absicoccus porci]|uniref:3-phosphoglycerate dehydrogenase n=1 Tax=Absicoccus porci TaxID=2486576 RepID=A0A3N0HXE2_9FIRM|nr:phosphoglycerate dehydrogenase [Absicoccus porci]RNM29445.1 3-phosphoglycerate dehydrogenase [Absicoccus porci]
MATILITPRGYAKYGAAYKKQLESAGYEVDWNDTGKPLPREVFVEKTKQATGIIVGVDSLDRDLLLQCKNLRSIVKFGVGLDNIDLPTCDEMGIKVGRCIGTNSNAVAELTVGMMFAAARDLVGNVIHVKNREWVKPTGFELKGKNIGIIGFGNIGKNVARMAKGIGMHIYAYDIFEIPQQVLDQYEATQTTVDEILTSCDFITIHTPLTDETRNMISTGEFKKMKNTAILINAARGGIVNEKAIYEALKNHEVHAVCSDVFTSEPPQQEAWIDELLAMDQFILTAHIASRSQEAEMNTVIRATEVMLNNLE